MTKYTIPDDHEWADEKEQADDDRDRRPTFETGYHSIQIDDNRDAHGYEHGLDWEFSVEEGVVVGYSRCHYLEGRTQMDYMNTPAWADVPEAIKAKLRRELNLDPGDDLVADLPDFYGEERRGGGGR